MNAPVDMSDEQRDALAKMAIGCSDRVWAAKLNDCNPSNTTTSFDRNIARGNVAFLESARETADRIIAAGWQYVGPDQVVVSRADYLTIYHKWEFEIGHADGGFGHRDAGRDMDIHERMRESLGLPEPEPRLFHDDDDEVAF